MKDYFPLFKTDVLTADERWLLLRKFIEDWYDFKISDNDYKTEWDNLQKTVAIKLPKSVERLFTLAKQLQETEHTNTYGAERTNKFSSIFRDNLHISLLEKHHTLTLLMQAEGDMFWGIHKTDVVEENPKVYSYFLDYNTDEFEPYGISNPTITSFLLNHMLLYLANCSSIIRPVKNVEPLRASLKANLKNNMVYDGLELFEDNNLIAFISEDLSVKDNFKFYLHLKKNREFKSLPEEISNIIKDEKEGGWTIK